MYRQLLLDTCMPSRSNMKQESDGRHLLFFLPRAGSYIYVGASAWSERSELW